MQLASIQPSERDQTDWIDNLLDHAPRLALLAGILLAWSLTLAWPPKSDFAPLVQNRVNMSHAATYPVQVTLPESRGSLSLERLTELVEAHPSIARLGLIPAPQEKVAQAVVAADQSNDNSTEVGNARDSSSFATAFADFTASLPASQRSDARAAAALAQAEGLEPGAFLKLNYDLASLAPTQPASGSRGGTASYDASDGSLTVTKPLLVDGESKGRAAIRIEEGAQLYIATAAVADALGARAQTLPTRIVTALETGSGFIPFHELRGAGVAVEYDPVTDRVSLTMPT